jgi:hypothetical protein
MVFDILPAGPLDVSHIFAPYSPVMEKGVYSRAHKASATPVLAWVPPGVPLCPEMRLLHCQGPPVVGSLEVVRPAQESGEER